MPKHTRDDAAIAERRKKVAALTLNRYDQTAIASMLGVNQSTVSRDIKFLMNKWRQAAENDILEHVGRELAELDLMEKEAAANYINLKSEGSLKQANTWMITRLQIKDRRSKLLGLDQPSKLELNDVSKKDDTPLTPEVISAQHELLKAVYNARNARNTNPENPSKPGSNSK
jgi:predicted transcriptional regulator